MNAARTRRLAPLATALLMAAALASPLAQAQTTTTPPAPQAGQHHHHHHGHHRHGHGMGHMLKAAGVSDTQMTSIRAIYKTAREDVRAQAKTSMALREQMAQAMSAPTINTAAVQSLQQQINAQRDVVSARMLQARLQVASVLTPQQRQTLQTQRLQMKAKWQARQQERAAS